MDEKYLTITLIILAILAGGLILGVWYSSFADSSRYDLDSFAQCLRGKDAVMYGAYWCPHCQNQKKRFGDAFQFIPYVECTEEAERCTAAGIENYPTWIFGGGEKFVGDYPLPELAKMSGCPLLPKNP